ncbi:hypothetical protein OPV22_028780 [Ensete ventricosum]|uniref:Uncharacterized protein n=1 Tax=Ensete ventricosum TaxID=4639 RepID=A0AAV8Q7C8_ENSVE|nr:hypothetical protein OPV22_028780 [Ensete ventricosum]
MGRKRLRRGMEMEGRGGEELVGEESAVRFATAAPSTTVAETYPHRKGRWTMRNVGTDYSPDTFQLLHTTRLPAAPALTSLQG